MTRIFFYPHSYFRDRQLDTIRRWPLEEIINPELAVTRQGKQVDKSDASRGLIRMNWKQHLPLPNIKRRPAGLGEDDIVYVWGAIISSGPFILDLDNPYALVGYNLRAMPFWRPILLRMLASSRCLQIRCMSNACRRTLHVLFGERVSKKATVTYPRIDQQTLHVSPSVSGPRFLFVGTQFEIKGGAALLKAWQKVVRGYPQAHLDLVTFLPEEYVDEVNATPQVTLHDATFSRAEIWSLFMRHSDVLILPTYVESFGMVALEALAHGLAIISTDVYALPELVNDGENGRVLKPPISVWQDVLPSSMYFELSNAIQIIKQTDTHKFEEVLCEAISEIASDPSKMLAMRRKSIALFNEKFEVPLKL